MQAPERFLGLSHFTFGVCCERPQKTRENVVPPLFYLGHHLQMPVLFLLQYNHFAAFNVKGSRKKRLSPLFPPFYCIPQRPNVKDFLLRCNHFSGFEGCHTSHLPIVAFKVKGATENPPLVSPRSSFFPQGDNAIFFSMQRNHVSLI